MLLSFKLRVGKKHIDIFMYQTCKRFERGESMSRDRMADDGFLN